MLRSVNTDIVPAETRQRFWWKRVCLSNCSDASLGANIAMVRGLAHDLP